MCSRNFWYARRKKLISVFHSTENSIESVDVNLLLLTSRELKVEIFEERFVTTIATMICLIFSLSFSISRCLIWKKRWNSNVLMMFAIERIILREVSLKNMQKTFDDRQMSKDFYRQRDNKILEKFLQSAKAKIERFLQSTKMKSKRTRNELLYKQHEIDRSNWSKQTEERWWKSKAEEERWDRWFSAESEID